MRSLFHLNKLRVTMLLLLLGIPLPTLAEPGASMAHLPFLWLLTIALAVGITWMATRMLGRTKRFQHSFWRWVAAAILFVLLLVFISPVIVGIGSILVTGRTM